MRALKLTTLTQYLIAFLFMAVLDYDSIMIIMIIKN